ncbi:MAG: PAS domain S-box protein [Gemmatimonadota bacterium]|nr:PAS domain S-box protein [Gemmatimonadota bacterium]
MAKPEVKKLVLKVTPYATPVPVTPGRWRRYLPTALIVLVAEALTLAAKAMLRPGIEMDALLDTAIAAVVASPFIWMVVSRQLARTEEGVQLRADARLATILAASIDGIITTTADGMVTRFNAGAEKIFGYEAAEMIGRSVHMLLPEAARDRHEAHVRAVAAGRNTSRAMSQARAVRGRRKDGTTFPLEGSISRTEVAGEVTLTAIVRDVTQRQRVEDDLRETRNRLTAVLQGLPVAVWTLDLDGRLTMAEGQVVDAMGVAKSELIGQPMVDLIGTGVFSDHEERTVGAREIVDRAIRGEQFVFAGRVRGFWLESHVAPQRDARGELIGAIGVSINVSERVQAHEARRQSEALFTACFDAAPVGIALIDVATGMHVAVNRRFAQIAARTSNDILGRADLSYVHPDDRARAAELSLQVGRHAIPSYQMDKRWIRPDGEVVWVRVAATRIDPGGSAHPLHVQIVEDVTERLAVQRDLEHAREGLRRLSRRLPTIQEAERRTIAKELHDELGQALSAAKISLDSIQRFPDADTAPDRIAASAQSVARALAQVRSLSLTLRPALLDDLGAAAAIRWLVEEHARLSGLVMVFRGPGADVRFDSDVEIACFRIAQAALANAERHAGATRVEVILEAVGDEVVLIVADDGRGFDVRAARERADAGESLGMLGMDERASLAGGHVDWESAPGKGTTVRARFPTARPASAKEMRS